MGVTIGLLGFMAGAAFFAFPGGIIGGAFFFGCMDAGKKLDQYRYKKAKSREDHVGKMSGMLHGIGTAVERLTASAKQDEGMKAFRQSPRFEELKKAYPEIAKEFNKQAGIAAKQAAELQAAIEVLGNNAPHPRPA